MDRIEVQVLHESHLYPGQMMMFLARLTQKGHNIKSMQDLLTLYRRSSSAARVRSVAGLPHGTIKRFTPITIAIVGASRRFLAQARTHQVGMTFVSASLQYSDYSNEASFVTPYPLLDTVEQATFQNKCRENAALYAKLIESGLDNDSAGYIMPQALRNILIIQGNHESWSYFIRTRSCNRNTLETQYITLRIWEELLKTRDGEDMFNAVGPDCTIGNCREGAFSCGKPMVKSPTINLRHLFPKLT